MSISAVAAVVEEVELSLVVIGLAVVVVLWVTVVVLVLRCVVTVCDGVVLVLCCAVLVLPCVVFVVAHPWLPFHMALHEATAETSHTCNIMLVTNT